MADAPSHTLAPAAVSSFTNCGAGDIGFTAAGFPFRVMAELVDGRLDVAVHEVSAQAR